MSTKDGERKRKEKSPLSLYLKLPTRLHATKKEKGTVCSSSWHDRFGALKRNTAS